MDDTLLLINFHNLDEVNMKISEALKHNTYFKKRLNNIQTKTKTLKNKKKKSKAGRKKCYNTYYLDKIKSSDRLLKRYILVRSILEKKENKMQLHVLYKKRKRL